MSQLVNETDYNTVFDDAVTEFKLKQKEVLQGFLIGCVQLGSILISHRDEMKKINKWMDYCREIDITVAQANQYIRLHEYSETMSDKALLGKVITNWAKANLFLSLKEEEKEGVLAIEGTTEAPSTTDEFREMVAEIKSIDEIPSIDGTDEGALWKQMDAISTDGDAMFINPKYTAEMLQKRSKYSVNTRPYLEAAIHLVNSRKLIEGIQKGGVILTGDEKEDIISSITDTMAEIQTLINNF